MSAGQGEHVTVLAREAVDALRVRPGGCYLDGTFGRGGHSRLILERLGPQGRLIALDKDPDAVAEGRKWADPRFRMLHSGFAALERVLEQEGVGGLDGVLLDLGVSSAQLEDAARGFSFRLDGPLDMRMDPATGRSAAEWLAQAGERELEEVIRTYGEERFAKQIARAVVAARARGPVATTRQFAEIVAAAVRTREPGKDPATRSFQALRIYTNSELEELSLALPRAAARLRPGGRLVVISFHSLEDRIVKRFMREASLAGAAPPRLPLRAAELPAPALRRVGRAIRPGSEEVARNPRSRSALMRVAEKAGGP